MTRASKTPASPSARPAAPATGGEPSFVAELKRCIAELEQRGEGGGTAPPVPGRISRADPSSLADGFADIARMRDAIAVALVLLDEILELAADEPGRAWAQDIADVFREVVGIATDGARAASWAALEGSK